MEQYACSLAELADELHMDDRSLMHAFLQGVKPALRALILPHSPHTFIEAKEKAVIIESAQEIPQYSQSPGYKKQTYNRQYIVTGNSVENPIVSNTCVNTLNGGNHDQNESYGHVTRSVDTTNRNHYPPQNPNPKCYFCGKMGHIAPNCWHNQRSGNSQGNF